MTRPPLRLVPTVLLLALSACASSPTPPPAGGPPAGAAADTAGAPAAARAWWQAFATADTAYLQAHTAPSAWTTLSSGRTFDRAATLSQAATHVNGGRLRFAWEQESVRVASASVAIVTARVAESDGPTTQVYQFLTALERSGGRWRISVAQSTREAAYAPTVSAAVAGSLYDYAGAYRTPAGRELRVVVRGSALALVEPSGRELPMEPIGPGIFEFRELSPSNGIVRFTFTRDAAGRVTAFSRLIPGSVTTFPRIP